MHLHSSTSRLAHTYVGWPPFHHSPLDFCHAKHAYTEPNTNVYVLERYVSFKGSISFGIIFLISYDIYIIDATSACNNFVSHDQISWSSASSLRASSIRQVGRAKSERSSSSPIHADVLGQCQWNREAQSLFSWLSHRSALSGALMVPNRGIGIGIRPKICWADCAAGQNVINCIFPGK